MLSTAAQSKRRAADASVTTTIGKAQSTREVSIFWQLPEESRLVICTRCHQASPMGKVARMKSGPQMNRYDRGVTNHQISTTKTEGTRTTMSQRTSSEVDWRFNASAVSVRDMTTSEMNSYVSR